jgi:histidinol-phosphate aminotransferase
VTDLHIYPDGAIYKLRNRLAQKHRCEMDEVLVGNGSNEVINMLIRTFCQKGDNVVVSDYAFVAYRICATAFGIDVNSVPMHDGYVHDLAAMAAACDANTKMVFVANPNNPTGTYVGDKALRAFLKSVPEHVIVVLDEAYVEYALANDYATGMDLRDVRDRLVISRTFSKCYGLAGLRCGYAVGPAELFDYVNRIREPFNANSLAQVGAIAALDDQKFVLRSVSSNEEGRKRMREGLEALAPRGVTWIPSQTNFLLVGTPVEGQRVYDAMLRHGVIVRPMAGYGLTRHVRITIGNNQEVERCMDAFVKALDEVHA